MPVSERLPEGAYRCSECGHGDRLYACAEAIVSGRLLSDGSVTEDDTTQTVLCETSIDCEGHPAPGHRLERWFEGRWTRWEHCEWVGEREGDRCDGGKRVIYGRPVGACPACDGRGGRWTPVPLPTNAR